MTRTPGPSGKRVVRFFISYAHADKTLVDALMKELKTLFASSVRYEFQVWSDHDILVGERWHAGIQEALDNCEFGLLLISPAFLASKFIGQHELPHFVAAHDDPRLKPIIPVGLVPVVFEMHDLKGLDRHQFFLFNAGRIEGRYYDQISGGPKRREFARQLYIAIEKRLDAFFAQASVLVRESALVVPPSNRGVADAPKGVAYRGRSTGSAKPEPIQLWREYMRDQIPPFFGLEFSEAIWNTGFVPFAERGLAILLVTLEKGSMAESFKYADHFLSPKRFQWQSQNRTARESKHGQLLRADPNGKLTVHLFIREKKTREGLGAPFVYCGPVRFESWEGDKPITVIWKLGEPVPKELRVTWKVPMDS